MARQQKERCRNTLNKLRTLAKIYTTISRPKVANHNLQSAGNNLLTETRRPVFWTHLQLAVLISIITTPPEATAWEPSQAVITSNHLLQWSIITTTGRAMEREILVRSFKLIDLDQDQPESFLLQWKSARVWHSHLMDLSRGADLLDKTWVVELAQERNLTHMIGPLIHLDQWAETMPWRKYSNMHHHPTEKHLMLNSLKTQLTLIPLPISISTYSLAQIRLKRCKGP